MAAAHLYRARASAPFGKLDGDALGSFKKYEFAFVEIHQLAAEGHAGLTQAFDLRLDILDGKTQVIISRARQVADAGVGRDRWSTIVQELNLETRVGAFQNHGDVIGLNVIHTHIFVKDLS